MRMNEQRVNALKEAILMVGFFRERVDKWREENEGSGAGATEVLLKDSARRIRRTLVLLDKMREEAEWELSREPNREPWEENPDGWKTP